MTPYLKYCDYYSYTDESYESRCRRAFGKSYYADYKSAKQAKKHMKTITVKVWDKKGKKKYTENSVSLSTKGLHLLSKKCLRKSTRAKNVSLSMRSGATAGVVRIPVLNIVRD